MLSRTKL